MSRCIIRRTGAKAPHSGPASPQPRGDVIVVQDADLEYNPQEFRPVAPARSHAVMQTQYLAPGSWAATTGCSTSGTRWEIKLLTLLSNMLSNLNLTDMETGYKMVSAPLLKSLLLTSDRFGFEPEITARSGTGAGPGLGNRHFVLRPHLRRGEEDQLARRGRRCLAHCPLQSVSPGGSPAAAGEPPIQADSRTSLIAGVLLLLGALVRAVGFLQNTSLNGDEAMLALSIATRSFGELLQPLDYGQVAPVPFLWAERLSAIAFGTSGYSLRLIPLITGIGLLWVLYRVADSLVGRVSALVTLALSATAYPLIRYSVEVKPYIVDSLVSVVLISMAVHMTQNLDDRRGWFWLTLGGALGVLLSTPALLVCVAIGVGLAVAAIRRHRLYLLPWLALIAVFWASIFAAAYILWYAPNAEAIYMREFWAESLLVPGTPWFLSRLGSAIAELSCTLTCWRGASGIWPVLPFLGIFGLAALLRRRGPEYGIFLVGPAAAVFAASMFGRYPVATRLVLFYAPLFAILVANGTVVLANLVELRWPRIHRRWIILVVVYPSLVLAATLAFAVPSDWGFQGTEVQPLAELFRQRNKSEPIYVFPRAVPGWVFHTTDWRAPDTTRLSWVASIAGPGGPGFINGASRGSRAAGDGSALVYSYAGVQELYGTSTGTQVRRGRLSSPEPDPGWAESEAWRIRVAAHPHIWIILADFTHGRLNEGAILMRAVAAAGGKVVFKRASADAVHLRLRFPTQRAESHGAE